MKKISYKFRLSMMAGLLVAAMGSQAQVKVSGSNGTDGSSFANLRAAFAAISAADQTGKTILVTLEQPTIVEDTTVLMKNNGWSSLTIRPSVPGVTVSGAFNSALICLEGATNVTIDGRVNGTGTTKDLTLINTKKGTAASPAQTILLTSDAKNNVFQYCTIKGVSNLPNNGTIAILAGVVDGNDNNKIDNCDVTQGETMPVCPIFIKGVTGITNDGTVISNCNISNFMQTLASTTPAGIYVVDFASKTTVDGNRVFWTAPIVPTIANTYVGISIKGDESVVKNNIVGYADKDGNGKTQLLTPNLASLFLGIQVTGSLIESAIVENNTVSNIEVQTSSTGNSAYGVMCGIFIPTLAGSKVNVINNKVNNLNLTTSAGRNTSNVYWTLVGVLCFGSTGKFIDNEVHDLKQVCTAPAGSAVVRGISSSGGTASVFYDTQMTHNKVYNLFSGNETSTATNQVVGIQCATQQQVVIERNFVYNLAVFNVASEVFGLSIAQQLASSVGNQLVKNNMVSLGNNMPVGGKITGIYQSFFASLTAHASYFNNSIYIGGQVTATPTTGATAAFWRPITTGAPGNMDVMNNIIANVRTGGTGAKHYVIRNASTNDYLLGWIVCDYNLYQMGTTASNVMGLFNTTEFVTFAAWKNGAKSDVGSFDVHSRLNSPGYVDPTSTTAPNLHIRTDEGTAVKGAGTDLSITGLVADDYDGEARPAGAYDIGADTNPAFTLPVFKMNGFTVPGDDLYMFGRNLDFLVTYTKEIVVDTTAGKPSIPVTLNTGGTMQAKYVMGGGTTQLLFRLPVATGMVDNDGVTVGSAIELNGSTMKTADNEDATLALPTKSTTGVLVDGDSAPSILSVTAPADKTYAYASNIDFVVKYNGAVTVKGKPQIDVLVGEVSDTAVYVSGSGSRDLTFRFKPKKGMVDTDGIQLGSSIKLPVDTTSILDGAMRSAALTLPTVATPAVLVDANVPFITSVKPCADGNYGLGSALLFTVKFNKIVNVSGQPQLKVIMSSSATTVTPSYVAGSGTDSLLFRSTITSASSDLDGIELMPLLELNKGTIKDAIGNSSDLGFTLPNTANIFVDQTVLPASFTAMAPADSTYKVGQNIDFTLMYDQSVDVVGTPCIPITLSGNSKVTGAYYLNGSGTNILTFRYTVVEGDKDADGISINQTAASSGYYTLSMNSGSIKTSGTQNVAKIQIATVPTLTGVKVDAATGIKGIAADVKTINVYSVNKTIIVKGEVSANATASIFDACGKMIAKVNLAEGVSNEINASSLKGLYIVVINNNGKKSVAKVIVK